MYMKAEMLAAEVSKLILTRLGNFDDVLKENVDTKAICIIREIQKILKDMNYSDFDVVEEVVCIFEKYDIDCGSRHDF